jgi:hypothetical protein
LAGQLGVALTSRLQQRGFLVPGSGKRFEVTPAGVDWFGSLAIDA